MIPSQPQSELLTLSSSTPFHLHPFHPSYLKADWIHHIFSGLDLFQVVQSRLQAHRAVLNTAQIIWSWLLWSHRDSNGISETKSTLNPLDFTMPNQSSKWCRDMRSLSNGGLISTSLVRWTPPRHPKKEKKKQYFWLCGQQNTNGYFDIGPGRNV